MATEISGDIDVDKERTENIAVEKDESVNESGKAASNREKSGIRQRIKLRVPQIPGFTDKKSNKPPPYNWAQQRLPACRPVYNGLHVFIVFTIIGAVLLILGAVFLALNLQLKEYKTEYTNCASIFPDSQDCTLYGTEDDFPTCADYVRNISSLSKSGRLSACDCYCEVPLVVDENMSSSPVYVYYELHNYYQNHRRYVNSWSPNSLRASGISKSRSDCSPFSSLNGSTLWPCGLIANSFFNDTLSIAGLTINHDNIAWKTDRDVRFKNPPADENPTNNSEIDRGNTDLPPNWLTLIDRGQRNESYMVWFRVSAFPNFRKLLGRIDNGSVPAGNYTLNIVYNYPVTEFDGEKHFVISQVSWLGTRNLFLGIAYLVTGGLSIVLGILLLVVHLVMSKWKTTNKNFLNREY